LEEKMPFFIFVGNDHIWPYKQKLFEGTSGDNLVYRKLKAVEISIFLAQGSKKSNCGFRQDS
jgi:hypothetical protein